MVDTPERSPYVSRDSWNAVVGAAKSSRLSVSRRSGGTGEPGGLLPGVSLAVGCFHVGRPAPCCGRARASRRAGRRARR